MNDKQGSAFVHGKYHMAHTSAYLGHEKGLQY